ncbi:MAG: AAA domain-containing protein [Candidatus Altiarchaeales archaeon]|nr:AAA domain-containing protein [Candidatus Altiarchaeales archaeon]MBD3416750.1 AAA domain-containing protein [Candidatus Altiarchaeales archaeon]
MILDDIESTADVVVPSDPIARVIGQDNAIEKIHVAIRQRRNLLLVGPPGVGKSMLAQALAKHLTPPQQQISVLHNPKAPNRPVVEVMRKDEISSRSQKEGLATGRVVSPMEVPSFVAERLGFRCGSCGSLSGVEFLTCPRCGSNKYSRMVKSRQENPVNKMLTDVFEVGPVKPEKEVQTSRIGYGGSEEVVVYQRTSEGKVRVLDQKALEEIRQLNERDKRHVIVPLERKNFVHMSGATETELLGDVRHDPYGSHPEIGTPAYLRVVAGAIHEAHEGVLFIDELPHLEHLQNFILTAMQEKKFPITGRNPQSAGASVKVKDVPCDFLFVGACNIVDVSKILPPLRSRIIGNGYEILLETTMPDTPENRDRILQFVAQEIATDGRIPHASPEVVKAIIEEAKVRAQGVDNAKNSLTLRLRDLGGVVRMAGDLAVLEDSEYIEYRHVERSLKESKSIEHQLQERYGSVWSGLEKDKSIVLDHDSADRSYG